MSLFTEVDALIGFCIIQEGFLIVTAFYQNQHVLTY